MKRILGKAFIGLIATGLVMACNEGARKETEEILVEDSIRTAQEAAAANGSGVREIRSSAVDNTSPVHRKWASSLKSVNPLFNPKIFVYFNPTLTEVINQREEVPAEAGVPEGLENIIMVKTRIDSLKNEVYTVAFNPGPSDDPTFIIYHNNRELLNVNATEVGFPGNGLVYVGGHTNNWFDQRRIFRLEGGRIREIEQPFLYVGLETKTNAPVTLYASNRYRQPVTILPPGADILVVLNQGDNYLIKDAFGVVGWWKKPTQPGVEIPISGLEYAGD
jgi:hypothetical protein